MLLAQQTAANLHAAPGDTVTIQRAGGLPPVPVRVSGVVDLPYADSLFQKVGAPPQSRPSAPPDNVVLMPRQSWNTVFGPLAPSRPDLVQSQIHTLRTHSLPSDPAAAYSTVSGNAHHAEVQLAGTGLVGDNLGSVLDAARSDALYAQLLFLFLGVPGAALAAALTWAVAQSGAGRRRKEQALLRTRGATVARLMGLAAVEAAVVAVAGAAGVWGWRCWWTVRPSTGRASGARSRSLRQSSNPSMSGSPRSMRRRSAGSRSTSARALAPSGHHRLSWPSTRRVATSRLPIDGSSSMTKMRATRSRYRGRAPPVRPHTPLCPGHTPMMSPAA